MLDFSADGLPASICRGSLCVCVEASLASQPESGHDRCMISEE